VPTYLVLRAWNLTAFWFAGMTCQVSGNNVTCVTPGGHQASAPADGLPPDATLARGDPDYHYYRVWDHRVGADPSTLMQGLVSGFWRRVRGGRKGMSLTKPTSASAAIQDFALQPGNTAEYYQKVFIPPGTRYQSGTAAAVPDWGRRGGGQQIELFDKLPAEHYGPAIGLPP
jgi:hypothetical protein